MTDHTATTNMPTIADPHAEHVLAEISAIILAASMEERRVLADAIAGLTAALSASRADIAIPAARVLARLNELARLAAEEEVARAAATHTHQQEG